MAGSYDDEDEILSTPESETLYVGIKNEGATCYLNSFIQTLYNIDEFRRYVYQTSPKKKDSIVSALQKLFYNLQVRFFYVKN